MFKPSICSRVLPYSPPYDWETTLEFFRAHQLPYIESVDDSAYERVIRVRHGLGWFRVEKKSSEHALLLSVWNGDEEDVVTISKSVRQMFDLDANPEGLLKSMSADGCMTGLWAQHPGLRLARLWSAYESVFTTVLGQLVSVAFGRALTQEFMRAAGSQERHPKTSMPISLFPSAKQILGADLSKVRTSAIRRGTIRSIARSIEEGTLDLIGPLNIRSLRKALRGISGVGTWTTEYVALRGLGDNDAFPSTDYALKRELKRHPEINLRAIQPWRGYAAITLWKRYVEAKTTAGSAAGLSL